MINDSEQEVAPTVAASPRHSVSVAAVVVDAQERTLLIQRRDNGHWEPPGGVLELGEQIIDGLRREVAEETGLEVQPSALTGVYKNMTQGVVALVFRCHPAGDRRNWPGPRALAGHIPGTDGEATALRWASREEVASLAEPTFAVRVFDAIDYVMPPAVRAHDGVRLI
jgi:8-oxo-dGTP diphosphatase